ncbi:MAG: transglutaminase-like domain-containing protein [Planctomycetota bacterium]
MTARLALAALTFALIIALCVGCGEPDNGYDSASNDASASDDIEISDRLLERFIRYGSDGAFDLSATAIDSPRAVRIEWQAIDENGRRIGIRCVRRSMSETTVRTETFTRHTIRRGNDISVTDTLDVFEETGGGRAVRYGSYRRNGEQLVRIRGDIRPSGVQRMTSIQRIRIGDGGTILCKPVSETARITGWDSRVQCPESLRRVIADQIACAPGAFGNREYSIADDLTTRFDCAVAQWDDQSTEPPLIATYRLTMTNGETNEAIVCRYDANGELIEAVRPSKNLSVRRVTEDDARRVISPPDSDIFQTSALSISPSDAIIPQDAQIIVWRLSFRTEADANHWRVDTARQTAEVISDSPTELRITTRAIETNANDPVVPESTRVASAFCQSDSEAIRNQAQRIIADCSTSLSAACAIEAWILDHWERSDYRSTFRSALEVHYDRRGDCSERGVYMVALLRSAGIPARLMLGVVLEKDMKFRFHIWVQAYVTDGVATGWREYDPTRGGCGTGHIALATDSIEDDGLGDSARRLRDGTGALQIAVERIDAH